MKHIRVEIADRIATITIARPPVHALDAQTFRELTLAFQQLGRTQDASVAILTAEGDRIFCGGVDLKDSARRHARTASCFFSAYRTLPSLPAPRSFAR